MSAVSVGILKGKSVAIGGPKERAPRQEAVHRSPSPGLLSVLLRPYWSPPPRSLLPTLVAACTDFSATHDRCDFKSNDSRISV